MKRSSASRRQAAGSIIVSVGDTVMGWGGGEAREWRERGRQGFVRGVSNIAFHDKRREMNGKRGFTRT